MILKLKRGGQSLTRRLLVAAVITTLDLTLSLLVPVDSSFWNASLRSLLEDDSTSWIRSALRVSRFFSRKPQNETDTIRTSERTCTRMVPCFQKLHEYLLNHSWPRQQSAGFQTLSHSCSWGEYRCPLFHGQYSFFGAWWYLCPEDEIRELKSALLS